MNIEQQLRDKLDSAIDSSRKGWDLKRKMVVFIDPEAKCPYCNEWFHTRRIWLINNGTNYLRGCWNLDGSPIASDNIIHPHAWMSGEVCLGEARSASEALFAGVAKGKHVQYVPRWLVQLGHDCGRLPYRNCQICNSRYFEDRIFHFGYRDHGLCSKDCVEVAKAFRCENCMCQLEMDQRRFCPDCDEAIHINCEICGERTIEVQAYHYSRNNLKHCCVKCFETRLNYCRDCGYSEKREDINGRGYCEVCSGDSFAPPASPACAECGDPLTATGGCTYCDNYCEDCETSPCACEPDTSSPSWIEEIMEEEDSEY